MSDILKADGFDDAIIGQCCVSLRLIYDINKVLNFGILFTFMSKFPKRFFKFSILFKNRMIRRF